MPFLSCFISGIAHGQQHHSCRSWSSPRITPLPSPHLSPLACMLMALPRTASAANGVRAVTNVMLLSTTSSTVHCLQPICLPGWNQLVSPAPMATLNQHHNFTLVAIETAGPFGPETVAFLRELGCHLKQATREAKSFPYLRQCLSVALQWGNAAAVMGALGGTTSPFDFFS